MTVVYIIAIFIQAGIIIYFVRRGRLQARDAAKMASEPATGSYEGMRKTALSITPQQLKLVIPGNETFVYGVIMDCHINEGIVTLTAYITGAASIYFSNGSSKAGGGKSPAVGEAALDFVTAAQDYIGRSVPVSTTELPDKGCVRFYLLTNHRVYAAQEQLLHFEDRSSPWLALFEKGNEVISLMHTSGNGDIVH